MERISARRAWHDVYFVPSPDRLEILMQSVTMGSMVSKLVWERVENPEDRRKTIIVGSHYTLTGQQTRGKSGSTVQRNADILAKVKRAIQRLPADLQNFGHYTYGPFTDEIKDQLHELVWASVYNYLPEEFKARTKRRLICQGLCMALTDNWRRTAFGGPSKHACDDRPTAYDSTRSYSPFKVCRHVFELSEVEMTAKHWGRDYEELYNEITGIIDDMEKNCLTVVADTIGEFIQCQSKAS